MDDLSVIDRFMQAFVAYIDSGFGLLGPDVAFLTTVLVGIDVTLAGLFWAMGGEDDVIGRFLKKILYVGAFALILGSFPVLAEVIFRSFAGLGLTAGGGAMTADDLLRPGYVAGTGFEAAKPMLDEVAEMIGFVGFFENFLAIAVLMIAWLVVVLSFFVLAVQLFVTVIEFKLTALAGFVLVPFALWNRTSFLAERVLGNVVASGIKLMVLAVIVGIGSGFFAEFVGAVGGDETDLAEAMSLVLGSLALLGLGVFGPGIASGLVAGAPQLGAGAALGTAAAAAVPSAAPAPSCGAPATSPEAMPGPNTPSPSSARLPRTRLIASARSVSSPPTAPTNSAKNPEPMPTITASTMSLIPEATTLPSTRSARKLVRFHSANGTRTNPASAVSLNSITVTNSWTASTKNESTTTSQAIMSTAIARKFSKKPTNPIISATSSSIGLAASNPVPAT